MAHFKANFKNNKKYENLRCDGCNGHTETQLHIFVCPAYTDLRKGRDMKNQDEIVSFYQ